MSLIDFPCDRCGADVGEPCASDCEGVVGDQYATEWELSALDSPLTGTPPVRDSEIRLMAAVHRLPFGGLIGTRGTGAPDRSDFDDGDEWLAALADWMTDYEAILREQVEELERQSRQRISMQIERDVLDGVIRRALEGADA